MAVPTTSVEYTSIETTSDLFLSEFILASEVLILMISSSILSLISASVKKSLSSFSQPHFFANNFIFSGDKIYTQWLKKKCMNELPLQPKYTIIMENDIDDILNTIYQDINSGSNIIFSIVNYVDMFHIAGLLIRSVYDPEVATA